jgi:putative CocE/NonD family hydrolase
MFVRAAPFCLYTSIFLSACAIASAQSPAAGSLPKYTRQDVMIPMRDGVQLHAAILRPAQTQEALPFLMTRTPYGVENDTAETLPQDYPELANSGYIFVEEDIRGRYLSQGKFVMMRPMAAHHDVKLYPNEVDESTDAYDTVAWLLTHIPKNNGRVGVFGVSYPGFLTMEAGIDPNPAVKAISPQAPMTDVWMGDDFFHNGAFRQSYGYDYGLGMESGKENAFGSMPAGEDEYTYFLKAGSFEKAIHESGTPDLPTWQAFLAHPAYDTYWQTRAVEPHLQAPQVPTLEVGGYWDQEDMWGTQEEYARLHAHDPENEVRMVLGPWNHGEWKGEALGLGDLRWGEPTGSEFQRNVEAPFFAHYLKGASMQLANTTSFQTGTDRWMHYATWPPKVGVERRALFLGAGQTLSFTQPASADAEGVSRYSADPADPIPYRARPIEATYSPKGSHWYTWLAQDQRPYTSRPDQLTWTMAPLTKALTLTGEVEADLWAATTGTDADWIVKLIDAYPDDPKLGNMSGYQLIVAEEIFRGRYRSSFEHPQAIAANIPLEYKWSLHGVDHAFLPGHRVLVEVQSTWFPLYDRNPQSFVSNIMKAKPSDFHAATQSIYWSAAHSSHLVVPVAVQP